jgi:hypothetical protein
MRSFIAIFVCLLPILAYGAKPPKNALPFDLSADRLPRNYQGHKLENIFSELSKLQSKLTKKEFETSAQHTARVQVLKNNLKVSGLSISSIFAFKLNDISYEYDADKQLLDVTIKPKNVTDDKQQVVDSRMAIGGIQLDASLSQYLARNVFGSSVVVDQHRIDKVELVPSNPGEFFTLCRGSFADRIHYISGIAPGRAESLVNGLSAIVIFEIENPSLYTGFAYAAPTYIDPVEVIRTAYYLEVRVKEIWIYNFRSGEILQKVRPNQRTDL